MKLNIYIRKQAAKENQELKEQLRIVTEERNELADFIIAKVIKKEWGQDESK